MGEERGLARTAPTSEANDAHAGTIAGQRVPGAVRREGKPSRIVVSALAKSNAPDGGPPGAWNRLRCRLFRRLHASFRRRGADVVLGDFLFRPQAVVLLGP